MAGNEKHPIRNIIIFPVIAGLILAGLLYFIPKFFAFVQNALSSAWSYLISGTVIPNTLLCLLVILAIPSILNVTKYLLRNRIQPTSNQTSIGSYTTDNFFGMTWKWSYIQKNDHPSSDIWCFCPICSTRLVYSSSHDFNQTTIFSCENCNFQSISFAGNKDYAFGKVARQIERKVTTGEWKDVVKRSTSN